MGILRIIITNPYKFIGGLSIIITKRYKFIRILRTTSSEHNQK